MTIVNILSELKSTAGSNAKKAILETHSDRGLLKRILRYGRRRVCKPRDHRELCDCCPARSLLCGTS